MLKFDDNLGAKQAFAFFVNTIPGNPHPAVQKQVPLFQQFMKNLDHSVNEVATAPGITEIANGSFRRADSLGDGDIPIVNGNVEATWTINRDKHVLEPLRGITFDRERPVFSSTSSWLLGRNVAPLPDDACDLLALVDGASSWSSIVESYAGKAGLPIDEGRRAATVIVAPLLAEDYVLVQTP